MRASFVVKAVGLVAAGAIAGTMSVAVTTPTQAFTIEHWTHFIECKTWLFTDPEAHAANCLPSRVVITPIGSTSTTGPGDDDRKDDDDCYYPEITSFTDEGYDGHDDSEDCYEPRD
jgi:hypothetical protein